MPGRLDGTGALGKRKRMEDSSDKHSAALLKGKSNSFNVSDQMVVDNVIPPTFFALSPRLGTDLPPQSHTIQHHSQLPQEPPRVRRKLTHRQASSTVHSTPTTPIPARSKSLQAPCHRCHKAPLQKTDLSSYTDCARCEERTCVICLRQCACQRKICADCSVEEGVDGDVYCLDCFGELQDVNGSGREEGSDKKDLDRDMEG